MKFKLFQLVRKLENVKASHTRDGKIHCLLKDNSRPTVENLDDLFKLGVDSVDYDALGIKNLE